MREKKHDQPRLGTVENYRHFWMISVWMVYFIIFYIAEHVVTGNYYPVHMPLDDVIPFCEWFIFPYCLWHWLLAIVGVYLLLWDAENFKRFTAFIGIGFIPVMLFDMSARTSPHGSSRASTPPTRTRTFSPACTSSAPPRCTPQRSTRRASASAGSTG